MRAHSARKHGEVLTLDVTDPRQSELAEMHMIGEGIGLIKDGDKTAWRRLIGIYFPGKESAATLNDLERSQFLAHLRNMKSAYERGRGQGSGSSKTAVVVS